MEKLIDRNNTSFTKQLYDTLLSIKEDKDDYLRYHQRLVAEYATKYPHIRGMLLYHKMGSGKTILGAAICEELMVKNPNSKVMFISAKSLHKNFRSGIAKYWGLKNPARFAEPGSMDAYVSEHYSFISANASNFMDQVRNESRVNELQRDVQEIRSSLLKTKEDRKTSHLMINLRGWIIIWDEFHNYLNSLANGSSNAIRFYDLLMNTPNVHIFGLTGTPIINDPYELALGFNLLAGSIQRIGSSKRAQTTTLFGEDYADFTKNFVNNYENMSLTTDGRKRPTMKNKEKFQDRILGLVSYYGADTPEMLERFPLEYKPYVVRVPMSSKQFAAYVNARDRELEDNTKGIFREQKQRLKKPSLGSTASFRPKTRQLSNVLFPPNASKLWRNDSGKLEYEKYADKLIPENLQMPQLADWTPKMLEMLTIMSMHFGPKILKDFKMSASDAKRFKEERQKSNIDHMKNKKTPKTWEFGIGPGLVYSQFIDSGIGFLGRCLKANGWVEIMDPSKPETNDGGVFATISGEVDPEIRDAIKNLFNSGGLDLLLVTSTGAEGLDLQKGRHIHIMEPFWYWGRIRQVITRFVRMDSHVMLALTDQNVQPYIYTCDYPSVEKTGKNSENNETSKKLRQLEPTTDLFLLNKALLNNAINQEFLLAVQDASIDKCIHSGVGNCRICSPTGRTLWFADDEDLDRESPCEPFEAKTIKAKPIEISDDDGTHNFMYTFDKGDIHIYEERLDLGGHIEIDKQHPLWKPLTDAIKKKNKQTKK